MTAIEDAIRAATGWKAEGAKAHAEYMAAWDIKDGDTVRMQAAFKTYHDKMDAIGKAAHAELAAIVKEA